MEMENIKTEINLFQFFDRKIYGYRKYLYVVEIRFRNNIFTPNDVS